MDRPILFSAPMVRALLAGAKTQTRRVITPQPTHFNPAGVPRRVNPDGGPSAVVACRYGTPGDRLWVREAFRFPSTLDAMSPSDVGERALAAGSPKPWCPTQFEADGVRRTAGEWRTFGSEPGSATAGRLRAGMHMPRWASRITLEITGVRVERLQDISEADAIAEGIERSGECNWRDYLDHPHNDFTSARRSYRSLWESINGAGSWDANPWVWVLEFKRTALEAAPAC